MNVLSILPNMLPSMMRKRNAYSVTLPIKNATNEPKLRRRRDSSSSRRSAAIATSFPDRKRSVCVRSSLRSMTA